MRNRMKQIKRFFSLLEILIAMTVAMGVFITGLYFYRYASFVDAELKKDEAVAFKARIMAARLSQVFSHLKKNYFFSTPEGPSLIFSFYNNTRLPMFHDWVVARLLVDPQKRLLLAVWDYAPGKPPPSMHLEVLQENVERLEFEFLAGPQEGESNHPDLKSGAFLTEWRGDFEQNPAAVKIRIKEEGKEEVMEFAFPLSNCSSP